MADHDASRPDVVDAPLSPDCESFDTQLAAWLEQALDPSANAWMLAHRTLCARCATMVGDLERLIAEASALPGMTPSRDLWPAIAARVETHVAAHVDSHVAIGREAPTETRRHAPTRGFLVSRRTVALAATLLVTASTAVTWQFARSRMASMKSVATSTVAAGTDPRSTPARLIESDTDNGAGAGAALDAGAVYQQEISALRTLVAERYTELDSATVQVLERNLAIIDQAIAESREALARNPRSALLASEVDRALEMKLALMRRVVLL